jgi:hypothetical protein
MPVGATAKEVKSVSGGEVEAGTKLTDDPGIGSRWPDAALNPSTCPEKLSTKNHSEPVGGVGFVVELPAPPHATAKIASDIASSIASFGFRVRFGGTPEFLSGLCAS